MPAPLTYRSYRPTDFSSVARLWADEAGWGDLTPELWSKWFEDTPHGPCPVFVAIDGGGEVVGQIVFTPSTVRTGGRNIRALRLSAPIVREAYRTAAVRSLGHPAIALWLTGAIACAARGHQIVYALPDRTWLPFFRAVGRFQVSEYPCLAIPLDSVPTTVGWWVPRATTLGSEHAAVWVEAREAMLCGVERSTAWLHYRHGGNVGVEVRDGADGPVVGYVAIDPKNGLLMDAMARSPGELAGVLAAAVAGLAAYPGRPFSAVKAMATPVLAPALAEVGFTEIDFRFGLVVDVLDPDLDPAEVSPERWYSMPGD